MSLKIFVAEDDDDLREMFTCQLEEQGHTVESFSTGTKLIEHFTNSARPPDILFLDLVMPGKSGLDVLKHIRSISSLTNLPIVVTSGYRDEKVVKACLQAGVKDFLIKPIETSTLIARLKGLMIEHSTDEARTIVNKCQNESPDVFETPEFRRYKNKGWNSYKTNFCNDSLVVLINESFSVPDLLKLDEDLLAPNLRIFVDSSPWVPTWPRKLSTATPRFKPRDELRNELGEDLYELIETHNKRAG
jgi:CheY-like chemotaxis protein